ncbi:MAG: ATP-dependent zinc metalloprotease FtsH [Treponema sp.]|jgi:cell division protease FtsH|nr:ATP-dependent zinc metalloprotease FtsH [Treponema sp.]
MAEQQEKQPMAKIGRPRPFAIIFLLVVVGLFAVYLFRGNARNVQELSYSEFINALDRKEISEAKIVDGSIIEGIIQNSSGQRFIFKTFIPYQDPTLIPRLQNNNVRVSGGVSGVSITRIILELVPWIIGFGFIFFILRNAQGPNNKALQFGKSRARLYSDEGKRVSFADVAGQKDAKYELEEVVSFLKNPQKFTKIGARIPKGVLLVGMPGTGKTLMARAVAGEAGVPYFHMSGSDFVEMFVGVGASRVRDLFEQGRKNAPCIIFIDELDAVGRTRGAGYGGGHDEREQTLNQLLVEMDGFDSKEGIIILAATNRPDVLDPAILRPGRFDRQVVVAMPDIKEREDILKIHTAKIPLSKEVDLNRIARATPGMSGADIANLANEAALFAARQDQKVVEMADFEEARDKILMGVARKTLAMSEKEKRMTAIHEAGHALLYYFLKNVDPLHKVTIVPRGKMLGGVMSLPQEDVYSRTRGWLEDCIVVSYGGWAAEQLIYGETTTGTKQDIQQATEMARRMVCEWGMSSELGAVTYGQEDEPIFLARDISRHKDYSEETAKHIDNAVRTILDTARKTAERILKEQKDNLIRLADALITHETLIDEEVRELLGFPPQKNNFALITAHPS